ncbi:MAG: TonB family protein [Prevotella sp.]|nr:TonB family protein [Prevotella sp.]
MTDFLIYDLKVAVLIAVFYMFYRLMLARETFHRVNRIVLLATAVASFVLPLCVITTHQTVVMPMPTIDVELGTAVIDDVTPQMPLWQKILPILYMIGLVATLANTLWSVFRITSLIKHSEQHPQDDGTMICVTGNAALAPFSWMHYIVMNRSDYETRDAAILTHERGHIRLHHSWDLILVDLLTAFQWFNPAMWMLRSDLRTIHEYEADGAVLSQGINARQYQYLLITKAGGIGGYSLANGITHSALKNRIHMMLHTKSPRRSLLKLLALLPIVGVTLALNAETVTDVVYKNDEPQKQVPVKKGKKNATVKTGNKAIQVVQDQSGEVVDWAVSKEVPPEEKAPATETPSGDVFDVVENMPQFPGGAPELFNFLAKNIQYPTEAENAGKQGRVIVTFVVGKDGAISDARVVKSVDPLLDEEALRVINAMPNWTPGTQSGKAVRVKYTVPITFRLDGGKPKEVQQFTGSFTPVELDASDPKFKEYVSRLPGAKIDENGNVTINGKPVKKIMVDGNPVKKIMIDGKPVENSESAAYIAGYTAAQGGISSDHLPMVIADGKTIDINKMKEIDPKTIESMTVLKDKAAINQYGEKAKDGVIIITTKK